MENRIEKIPTLSGKESLILQLLLDGGNREKYGLEMVAESGCRLKPGTVYVTLARMADKGFVESRREERRPGAIGLPRRLYRVTAKGQQVYAVWQLAADRLIPELGR